MPKRTKRQSSKEIKRPVQAVTAANKPFEFNPDYSYVFKDLRTIGVLAGAFITALVVLSIFLK